MPPQKSIMNRDWIIQNPQPAHCDGCGCEVCNPDPSRLRRFSDISMTSIYDSNTQARHVALPLHMKTYRFTAEEYGDFSNNPAKEDPVVTHEVMKPFNDVPWHVSHPKEPPLPSLSYFLARLCRKYFNGQAVLETIEDVPLEVLDNADTREWIFHVLPAKAGETRRVKYASKWTVERGSGSDLENLTPDEGFAIFAKAFPMEIQGAIARAMNLR